MKVEFKYNLDDEVRIGIVGVFGFIRMLGYDEAGPQYFVETGNDAAKWYKEDRLELYKNYMRRTQKAYKNPDES